MTSFLIILVTLAYAIVFLALFRAEALLAFYIMGVQLVFLVVEPLGIPWSTEKTGAIRPIVLIPLVLWWWLGRRDPQAWHLPRRFGASVWIIMSLFALWELKYFLEGQYLAITARYEYYKWAYIMQGWGGGFALGVLMPLTVRRLRRLLGAMGFIGATQAILLLGSFILGFHTASDEARYSPSERATGLGFGVYTAMGAAGLMAWMVLSNEIRRSQRRTIFGGILVGVMILAALLTGSRGPMAASVATVCVMLMISGGRRAFSLVTAILGLSLILYIGWDLIPTETKERLFGTFFTQQGVGERWALFMSSFRMLGTAPFFGRTREIESVTGFIYSHQIITEVMVEMGLVGLGIFLTVFIGTVLHWLRGVWTSGTVRLFAAPMAVWFAFEFSQRNIAGELSSTDFWTLMGIMMGHRLLPRPQGLSAEAWKILRSQVTYEQVGGYAVPVPEPAI
jgi:hypothetical protein